MPDALAGAHPMLPKPLRAISWRLHTQASKTLAGEEGLLVDFADPNIGWAATADETE
jgi:hypothetical protein